MKYQTREPLARKNIYNELVHGFNFDIAGGCITSIVISAMMILIINPIPKTVNVSENGKTALIDNGDRVGEYKIYSATALVNAIDRNCLDR